MDWFKWVCPFDKKIKDYNKKFLFNKQFISVVFELASHGSDNGPDKSYFPKISEKEIDDILHCCWRVCDCAVSKKINSNHEFISMLFFNVIKNHYLCDGNKRTGVIMCLICLAFIDSLSPKPDDSSINKDKLESLAKGVASNKYKEYQEIYNLMKNILKI